MKEIEGSLVSGIESNKRRDFIMGTAVLGAAGLIIPHTASTALTSIGNGYIITVGNGGMYASLQEAVTAASLLNPTELRWALIQMMPGIYDLSLESTELALPDFTELSGITRHGCIILGVGNNNIRINAHNKISNCTIKYTGSDKGSGAIQPQDTVKFNSTNFLDIDEVNFDVYQTHTFAVLINNMSRIYIRNSYIKTSGIGLKILGGRVFISGTHCRLVSNISGNTFPHYGIEHTGWARVWVDGGTWSTSYGEPEIDGESGADIVMFHASGTTASRLELNNVWSIVRNNSGASTGTKIANIEIAASTAWVRVRSGYFQSEDNGGTGDAYALMNSASGELELQNVRYRNILGRSFSSDGSGIQIISDAVYVPDKRGSEAGIKIIDASGNPGGMTVKLVPWDKAIMGSEQVIVRIDDSGHEVTIDGNGHTINGAPSRKLGPAQYSKLVLRYAGESIGWLVV